MISRRPPSRPRSSDAGSTSIGGLEPPRDPLPIALRGHELITQPLLNKGTAFDAEEREALGLRGLLPAAVSPIEEQLVRELEHVRRKGDDLERYIGLAALQDRNETLFYRLLLENLEEFLPIIYTPTVGEACREFSHIFRRPRGIWITPADVEHLDDLLRSAGGDDVRLIVVTDNERILGLGDQGVGGIAIPIGKLALYTAAAGIYPARTLPVSLDVGTDRRELLDDPLYLGYRTTRLRGAAYDRVVEAFVESVRRVYPRALVQWEDFKQHNALRILRRYRGRLPSFNDDVQGTGAVVLGGLLAARRGRGGLGGERFLFLGAGAAATGIASLVRLQLAAEGVSPDPAEPAIALMDSKGLLHAGRADLTDEQRVLAVDPAWLRRVGLDEPALGDPVAVALALRPSVLVGTTGSPGAFTEALVREVARHDEAPIILPLSNPHARAEARASDILDWTEGRALVATGSPAGEIVFGGRRHVIGQANNVFIFPGVGLGALIAEARELTDEAFLVAARTLADLITPERLAVGAMYPPIAALRPVARAIAVALVRHLGDSGYGRTFDDAAIEAAADRAMWEPRYVRYVAGPG